MSKRAKMVTYIFGRSVSVSQHSTSSRRKWFDHLLREIGMVTDVKRQGRAIRIEYIADWEDPGQKILMRVAKSGKGYRRRFRIGDEEFDGMLKSVKQERFNARDPLAFLRYTATISVPSKAIIVK